MRPRIDAKINGQDARFLVDSGAAFSVISSATAAQFNLRLQDAPYGLELRGFGGTVKPRMATVKDFLLAGFLLHNKEFLVVGSEVGGGGGGLLGQDFLQAFDVEYDLADGVIRLFRVENCKHAMLAYWLKPGQAYSVLDIESTSPSRPHTIAPVYVNGKKLRALFDTGAQVSVLSLRAAKEAGVNLETPGVQKAGAWGGIGRGSTETYIAPFASFKVGDAEEIQNTRLRIADTGAAAADMFIGDDFFLSHRLFVSNSQHKMYLTYNGGAVFNLESPPTEVTPAEAKQESQEFIDAGDLARRGAASADRRDYGAALADLTRAVELDPNEPEYVYRRAMVYLARKQPELALADLNQALSLKPDFLAALISRAEFRLGSQDAAGAAADLAAADRAAPSQSDTRYALAGLYERAEDFHGAIEQFDLWIANHRDDRRILGALHGRCWSRAMQGTGLDAAISDCNDALRRMEKKNAAAYSALLDSRGFVYLRSGELNKAVADFDSSLKLNPKSASALYGRGVAKSRMSNAAEGRADIAAATSLDPQIAEFFSRREIVP
ncbi:MAG TPA: aspartyl protease family protein [Steroidobacteraceae bacterium]|jgi:tetratricopeptide (TPR) repeat protein/predicted aspartyl protease